MYQTAQDSLARLKENPYPGRGIVIGLDEGEMQLVQVYWTMGRSENSRNRVLSADGGRVFTEFADSSKSGDPKLVIYNAMDEVTGYFVVGNGNQTNDVMHSLQTSLRSFVEVMLDNNLLYEPDAPNFTPRITGVCSIRGDPLGQLCVLKKASLYRNGCQCNFFSFRELEAGLGYCVTTYLGDGDPLPSFWGEPYLLPLRGNTAEIGTLLWDALDPENRVSLVVKSIEIASGKSEVYIINKYEKV